MEKIIKFLKLMVMLIVLVIWSVIGFIFWIPMLARAIAVFSAAIAVHTFNHKDPVGIEKPLELAIRFFPEGYPKIISSIFPSESFSKQAAPTEIDLKVVGVEIIWSIISWLMIIKVIW